MSDERIVDPETMQGIPEMIVMPRMSLWQIDEGLAAMVEYRQQRCDDTEDPPDAEELAAIDGQIAMYMEALPRKVDSTAGVFRWWGSQLDTILGPKDKNGTRHGGEVDRLKGMAKAIEGQIERLKECCAAVLEKQPLPAKGSRALSGTTSKILLKTNGGLEPLVITDQEMLPEGCCRMEGWVRADLWNAFMRVDEIAWTRDEFQLKRIPDNAAIRAALAEPCPTCGPLENHGEAPGGECPACHGSRRNAVPGAHLEPRGAHVEIR